MSEAAYQVLLYYRYTRIEAAEAFAARHREFCEVLGLRGRILVSEEGLNGTVSGLVAETEAYMEAMREDDRFRDMVFKVDGADGHVFPKLSVKWRPEVVTLGLEKDEDIDPNELTGTYLNPEEWFEAMQREDVVILDGRNRYESDLGRFKGAVCPDVEHFRDFPEWIEAHRAEWEGRRVLTYCTGGIRCEKLSGYLKRAGVEDVGQLEGGIIAYGKDESVRGRGFEGLCYVFDERLGVEVNRTEGRRVISRCVHCGEMSARYRNCAWSECNEQIFCCERCEREFGRVCSAECLENLGRIKEKC
ncbi:MAG: rhodanese-related sulfurtransferase [Verrucomicrobiota bacterium]